MGSKKKRNLEKRLRHKQKKAQKNTSKNNSKSIDRRSFLQISTAFALASGGWYYFTRDTSNDILDLKFLGEIDISMQKIKQSGYNSMHTIKTSKQNFTSELIERVNMDRPNLLQWSNSHSCDKLILNPKLDVELRLAADPKYSTQKKEFYSFALNFLREHNAFRHVHFPDYEVLTPLENKKNATSIPIYLTRGGADVFKLQYNCIDNKGNTIDTITKEVAKYHYGGLANIYKISETENESLSVTITNPYITLAPNTPSAAMLVAYSEYIPFIFHQPTKIFFESHASSREKMHFHQFLEAYSESLSHAVAIDLLNDPKMEMSKEYTSKAGILEHLHMLPTQLDNYLYCPAAYKYIEEKGLEQTVVDLNSDPIKYFSDVQTIHAKMS
mgnify:CR=1 FL=1|tara:strand:+ start:2511 stop:3665 length:1155 start_codon:yes stop_codon:yes gene_type:complete